MTHQDDLPPPPDGPTPAREQLPLPRRQRQSHLEPQLRTPGSTGSGTPFAAFAADGTSEHARHASPECCTDRAAAFHAGVRRGRSSSHNGGSHNGSAHSAGHSANNGRHRTDR